MPIVLIDKIEQSNRSANVTTSGFFHLADSIDTNFNVTGRQTDNTDPGNGTPAAGERWIITNISSLSTLFSAAGLPGPTANNDIVEYSVTGWSLIVDVSNAKTNEGQLVYVADENLFYFYNGSAWVEMGTSTDVTLVTSSHDYLSLSGQAITLGPIDISDDTNLVAGTNITLAGDTLNVDDAFLKNDGSDSTTGTITAAGFTTTGTWTFDTSAGGTTGITSINVGAAFTDDDVTLMSAGAIKEKIEGYGYSTTTGTVTSVSIGGNDGIDVDSGSPITGSGTIQLGLSNIANDKLANDSVNFGGVTLSLGGTDTTPAFDLQHATGYPTGNLVGTISNAQLAGSIADGKISSAATWNAKISHDGSTTDGVLTYKDADEATVEPNLQFDGTTLKIGALTPYGGSIAGKLVSNPRIAVNNGTIDKLAVEASGKITLDSGIRAYGNSFVMGPKGGGTINFISNEGVETQLNGGIASGEAFATVDSTDGMAVGDKVIFSVANSDSDSSANQSSEFTIDSVDSTTQFTVTSAAIWSGAGPAPAWSVDNSWVDVLGTGNLNFRNSNVKQSGESDLQFDYAAPSLGKDGGSLKFRTYNRRPASGVTTAIERLTVDSTGKLIFNPTNATTADFVIEGATENDLFYADASADRVGIAITNPKFTLDVGGSMGGKAIGPKTTNYTLSAADYMVFTTLHDSATYDITTPAVHEEGRMIYIICDSSSGSAPFGKHQIVANSGHTLLYDNTVGDIGFQLTAIGQMITLIGTKTADTWICVKSGHQSHTH